MPSAVEAASAASISTGPFFRHYRTLSHPGMDTITAQRSTPSGHGAAAGYRSGCHSTHVGRPPLVSRNSRTACRTTAKGTSEFDGNSVHMSM